MLSTVLKKNLFTKNEILTSRLPREDRISTQHCRVVVTQMLRKNLCLYDLRFRAFEVSRIEDCWGGFDKFSWVAVNGVAGFCFKILTQIGLGIKVQSDD